MTPDSKSLSPETLYYDSMCAFCSFFVTLITKIYPIKTCSAWDNLYTKNMMLQKYTWVYTDNQNKEWLRGEALLQILKTKKMTTWVYVIFNNKFSIAIINTIYSYIARNRLCLSKGSLSKKPSTSLIKKAAIIILLLSSLVCIYYRQTLLYNAGNFFFGGKFYNISLAKTFFTLADKSNDTKIMWLNYQLSRIYFIEGNLDQALTYSNKEVRYHPENCRTYYIRGLTFGYLDRLDAAIEDFEKFNTCFPDSWAGHNDIAWFYFRKGDIESMRKTIAKSVFLYPNNPWVLNTYGIALLNSQKYREAVHAFTEAKKYASMMRNKDWGQAYPGNDPRIYSEGKTAMQDMIESNLSIALAEERKSNGFEDGVKK